VTPTDEREPERLRPGANVNVLLESGRRDLVTGTAAFNAVPVLLRPLREAAGE
jgi:hypothetical protein